MTRRGAGHKQSRHPARPTARPATRGDGDLQALWLPDLARRWTTLIGTLVAGLLTWLTAMLFGMQPIPGTVPLAKLVHDQPLEVVLAGAALLVLTALAWAIAHERKDEVTTSKGPHPRQAAPVRLRLVAVTSSIATVSTIACIAIVTTVLLQPDWCPVALCRQPAGPNDKHLEADFVGFQSPTYAFKGDPSHFLVRDLPSAANRTSVAAQRTLAADSDLDSPTAYRIALTVHNLEPDAGMLIQRVELAVIQVSQPSFPLRVILIGVSEEYRANPYRVVYDGSGPQRLVAQYLGTIRVGHVQLKAGETDALGVQVAARHPVDVRFQLSIAYRITSETTVRTFDLPYVFEAVFSDQLNWQQFEYRDRGLVPD